MVRVALLGAGPWGRNLLKTAVRLDGFRVTRIASNNPETAALAPDGCRVDRDWRAAATAEDVDAVLIATPPALHAEMARAALEAGKALFIEKPLALDPFEAAEIRDLAEDMDVTAFVDHIHLFAPAWEELKKRLDGIGPIRSVAAAAGRPWVVTPSPVPVLWDWGAHDMALCIDLFGTDPTACGADVVGTDRGPQDATLTMDFAGVPVRCRLSNNLDAPTRRFEVTGTAGTLVYDDKGSHKLTLDGSPVPVSAELPLDRALAAFARTVVSGGRDRGGLDLGVRVVAALARCTAGP